MAPTAKVFAYACLRKLKNNHMKKYFAILAACTIHMAQAADTPPLDLHGVWSCAANYPVHHISIVERTEYQANGRQWARGEVVIDESGTTLIFAVDKVSRWKWQDGAVHETILQQTVKPLYLPETQAALNASPELARKAQTWHETLTQTPNQTAIVLPIQANGADSFTFQQPDDAGSGSCVREPQ